MYWLFENREQAGQSLADQLEQAGWKLHPPQQVLGLARGGVAVARPVAQRLGCPLEVLVVRKIGAPENEEFGVGALCEDGEALFSRDTLRALSLKPEDLAATTRRRKRELEEKIRLYRGQPFQLHSTSGSILVVDDGLATGISAEAAARYLRRMGAKSLSLAVPVAAADSAETLRLPGTLYDDVTAVQEIQNLGSVGSWYREFSPVSDAEVLQLLGRPLKAAA